MSNAEQLAKKRMDANELRGLAELATCLQRLLYDWMERHQDSAAADDVREAGLRITAAKNLIAEQARLAE